MDLVSFRSPACERPILYNVKQSPTEKAKLLRMVLSNCAIDAVSLYPTYRKPFDLIFRNEASDAVRHRIASLAILSSQEALAHH